MKTPEEIKKGLECCILETDDTSPVDHCRACPYQPTGLCFRTLLKDALTYIQQLEQINADFAERTARLEAQAGKDMNVPYWISVEERLPERHGQMCVCLYNQHGAPRSILFPYVFTWHAYGDNGYVNGPHFSDEGLDGLKVYYWMPLPEPPKEG